MANDDREHYIAITTGENLPGDADSRVAPVNRRKPYISKVPSLLREVSPDSFKPQLVSIGPLHKQDKNLNDIERLKESFMQNLFERSTSSPNESKERKDSCLESFNKSISKIRSFYAGKEISDADLANMMVMDGSFIIEFCLKEKEEIEAIKKNTWLNMTQKFRIAIDLMLLENQIPFFVLQCIFNQIPSLLETNSRPFSLTSLIREVLSWYVHPFKFSRNFSVTDFSVTDFSEDSEHTHVLHCLHKIYKLESREVKKDDQKENGDQDEVDRYHSVVELDRSGVSFKPHKKKNKSMAIDYEEACSCFFWPWRKPALVMPTLYIQDYTEVVLRNFIAYEQFFLADNYYFTYYTYAMDRLIDNQADVGILVESEVLMNNLGSHKKAAKIINSLCKNIIVENFYYTDEMTKLHQYYDSPWPKSFANLKRTYFNSPWNLIALLAGISLFVLTVVQTIFTVMSYNP